MKKLIVGGLLALSLVILPNTAKASVLSDFVNWVRGTAAVQTATPTISYPINFVASSVPETLYVGQEYEIKWETSNRNSAGVLLPPIDRVYISVTPGAGYEQPIETVANTGVYKWIVKKYWPNFDKYSFHIIGYNGIDGYHAESAKFTIIDPTITPTTTPSITVLSQNTIEKYKAGDTVKIRWSQKGLPSASKIGISLSQGGSDYIYMVASQLPVSATEYDWVISPDLLITKFLKADSPYKINVYDYVPSVNNITSSLSNASISISPLPEVAFNVYTLPTREDKAGIYAQFAPGGAQNWNWQMTIDYPATGTITDVMVERLYIDETWSTGGLSFGHPTWPLVLFKGTQQVNTKYVSDLKLQLKPGINTFNLYGLSASDSFDNAILIVHLANGKTLVANLPAYSPSSASSTPSIRVTSPNGGESYKAGDTVNVTWKTLNFGTKTVWLTLADKNGTTVPGGKLNAANIQNSGTYSWKIPTDIVPAGTSGAFKVVASSFDTGPSASDLSDNYFTVTSGSTTQPNPSTLPTPQPSISILPPNGGTPLITPITLSESSDVSFANLQVKTYDSDVNLQRVSIDLGTSTVLWTKILKTLVLKDASGQIIATTGLDPTTVTFSNGHYIATLSGFNRNIPKTKTFLFQLNAYTRDSFNGVQGAWIIGVPANGVRIADANGLSHSGPATAWSTRLQTGITTSITVLSPNGGETWQIGTTQNIVFQKSPITAKENIYLVSYTGATIPNPIFLGAGGTTTVDPSTGKQSTMWGWNVGSLTGGITAPQGSYYIKICDDTGTSCDASNSYFNIIPQPPVSNPPTVKPASYTPTTSSSPTPSTTPSPSVTSSPSPSTSPSPSSSSSPSPSSSVHADASTSHNFIASVFYSIGDMLDSVF